MRHLLALKNLQEEEIMSLLQRAREFKQGATADLRGHCVANLFFEPSTRTHYSFLRAEQKLGLETLDFNPAGSSLAKGESLEDTVRLFTSLGVDALVIREREDRYYERLLPIVQVPILNAGDGKGDHPTQSLLDLMTILETFGTFNGLQVLIYGDLSHSRVANTNVEIFQRLGMIVETVSPPGFEYDAFTRHDLKEAIPKADVIMGLRIQHERHSQHFSMTQQEYLESYGLDEKKLALAKKGAIIMHPAPVNRGWEMADAVVDGEKSRIFQQMENGVYVRMAVLERALKG